MELATRMGWETIYEEEDEDSSTTPSLFSPSLSSPPTPFHSRVKAWSLKTGHETDVVIHIQSSSFHLHKDPLVTRSGYLKRQLTESSQITLSPPLKITAETFTLVADFCYGGHLFITPFNVASLLIAAELLEMTEIADDEENLRQKTEAYFCRTVAVNRDYASVVLRSCLLLMPEAETTAFLVSRCIEALSLTAEGGGDFMSCFDDIKLSGEDFRLIVESLHGLLTGSHDLLYRIVDFYLKEHNGSKISEEQKTRMCNYIDCTNLSPQLLMHAVQNPRMPLRFIVQAMFIEQLNTRRSVFSAAHTLTHHHRRHQSKDSSATTASNNNNTAVTLGAILQRDATLCQVAHLKTTMDATSSRIQSLEKEISGMKKIIQDSENLSNVMNLTAVKSESFRFSSERMVERGQRGSVSSGSFRVEERVVGSSSSGEESPRTQRHFGRRLMNGLRSAFRVSKKFSQTREGRSKVGENGDEEEDGNGKGNVIVIKKDVPFHHRSRSLMQ